MGMKHAICFFCMILLVACAQTQSHTISTVPSGQMTYKPLGEDELLSRVFILPPQTMPAGECGLFLWLRRDDAPLVLFQEADASSVKMILDGEETILERTTAEGPILSLFFESQQFQGNGFDVSLSIKAERDNSIRQGLRVPSGALSINAHDGWSGTLPVAGVIGCQ